MFVPELTQTIKTILAIPNVDKVCFHRIAEDHWLPFCRCFLQAIFTSSVAESIIHFPEFVADHMYTRMGHIKGKRWIAVYSKDEPEAPYKLYLTLRDNRLEAQFDTKLCQQYGLVRKALVFAVQYDLCDRLELHY